LGGGGGGVGGGTAGDGGGQQLRRATAIAAAIAVAAGAGWIISTHLRRDYDDDDDDDDGDGDRDLVDGRASVGTPIGVGVVGNAEGDDVVIRSPQDKRGYRTFHLPNGLRCLVRATQSLVSMRSSMHVSICCVRGAGDPLQLTGLTRAICDRQCM
jgi:hypothetical protein